MKQNKKDLLIIFLSCLIPVTLYIIFENSIMEFAKNSNNNIWIRTAPIILIQFGMGGLSWIIVMLYRREKFKDYGINNKNTLKTILLSSLVCIPHFIYLLINNKVNSYFPLQGSIVTRLFLQEPNPTKIIGYIICIINWGFIEAFFYPVVSKKINGEKPKNKYLNKGAIICGIICILIHGMIGFDLNTLFEALTTFILIYGMLLIKEETNNSWGCILIFIFFWNAFR